MTADSTPTIPDAGGHFSAFERQIDSNLDNPRPAEVLGEQTAAYKAATRVGG
jgi:hypothetical protein